jgi:acetyltransferase-like isoleucine patch superfamily enzyme/acyl carrier protein
VTPPPPWAAFVARRQLRDCTSVGRNVRVDGKLHVQNLGAIILADSVQVRSTPAMSHLVTGPHGTLRIGAGAFIGHGAAIAAHENIDIGAGSHIGPFVMLMDTDFHEAGKHDAAGGTGAIRIGVGVKLGARVTVLRDSTIGDGAVVAPGSVVKGDVPAGAYVSGNPARVRSDRDDTSGESTIDLDSVRAVVQRTFGLAQPPESDATRDHLPQWDSLGTLNLLLSLEEAFGVSVGNDEMSRALTVAELVPMLERAADAS